MVQDVPSHMRIAARYLGLPLQPEGLPSALPAANTHNGPAKVTAIDCEVRARLARLYRPWNRKLYAMLRRDEETRAAPAGEPPFRPFWLRVLCYNSSSPKIHIE